MIDPLLLVVADLHLDYSKSDEVELLKKLIAGYSGRATALAILGDAFESPPRNDSSLPELGSIIEVLKEFMDKGGSIYYVVGNHDLGMTALKGRYYEGKFQISYPSVQVKIEGLSVHLEHGHLYDPLFKHSVYDLLRVIEERVNLKVGDVAESFLKALFNLYQTKQQEDFGVPEFLNRIWIESAGEILEKERVEVVVFGHTHRPEILSLGTGKYYVNAGSWHKNLNYGTIDGKSAKIFRYEEGREIALNEVEIDNKRP